MQRRNVFALLLIKCTYILGLYIRCAVVVTAAAAVAHTLLFRCSGFMTNNIVVVVVAVAAAAVAVFVSAVIYCMGILVHGSANKTVR